MQTNFKLYFFWESWGVSWNIKQFQEFLRKIYSPLKSFKSGFYKSKKSVQLTAIKLEK